MKILLTEQHSGPRRSLEKQLKEMGHEILAIGSEQEAYRILQEDDEISLLIIDWADGDTGGLELCGKARGLKRERFLPILMVSSRSEKRHLIDALNAGADAFVSKPINMEELRAQIQVLGRVLDLEAHLAREIRNIQAAYKTIQEMAETDELTGMPNRRSTMRRLESEIARAERYGVPLSIVILDLDHFKDVNDTYGHPAGDAVLQKTARLLEQTSRDSDFIGRFGGEEFLGILPQTGLEGAFRGAERIRAAVESQEFRTDRATRLSLTVSLGIATWKIGADDVRAILARADKALYRAKAEGRNRVEAEITSHDGAHPL